MNHFIKIRRPQFCAWVVARIMIELRKRERSANWCTESRTCIKPWSWPKSQNDEVIAALLSNHLVTEICETSFQKVAKTHVTSSQHNAIRKDLSTFTNPLNWVNISQVWLQYRNQLVIATLLNDRSHITELTNGWVSSQSTDENFSASRHSMDMFKDSWDCPKSSTILTCTLIYDSVSTRLR